MSKKEDVALVTKRESKSWEKDERKKEELPAPSFTLCNLNCDEAPPDVEDAEEVHPDTITTNMHGVITRKLTAVHNEGIGDGCVFTLEEGESHRIGRIEAECLIDSNVCQSRSVQRSG